VFLHASKLMITTNSLGDSLKLNLCFSEMPSHLRLRRMKLFVRGLLCFSLSSIFCLILTLS